MKASLSFVPPGGGEQDYGVEAELPAVPRPGDYVSVVRKGTEGSEDFIVRRAWWSLVLPGPDHASENAVAKVESLTVECEFALGLTSSHEHKRACECYRAKGRPPQDFVASAY